MDLRARDKYQQQKFTNPIKSGNHSLHTYIIEMTVPTHLDIPRQVQIPSPRSSLRGSVIQSIDDGEFVRAVVKYLHEEGRTAIINAANTIHHDFSSYNQTLAISIAPKDLEELKSNPNIDCFEGDGKVMYCSIR